MTKSEFIRKITSRKLWLAIASFVTCLIIAFNGDSSTAETVTACIMAGGTAIAYIFGEGWTDASYNASQGAASAKKE